MRLFNMPPTGCPSQWKASLAEADAAVAGAETAKADFDASVSQIVVSSFDRI